MFLKIIIITLILYSTELKLPVIATDCPQSVDISYFGNIDEINVTHTHIQVLCTFANTT